MKNLIEYILENRGYDFEAEYLKNWQEYKIKLIDTFKKTKQPVVLPKDAKLDYTGKRNVKRPLIFSGDKIEITNGNSEASGDDIADYRVISESDQTFSLNLSLKYGKTITYLNCGVAPYFDSDYNPIGNGKMLLNFFGIDPKKFTKTFTDYKKRNEKPDTITVYKKGKDANPKITTDTINIDNILNFLKQTLGYGYILIHKIGNNVKHCDLRTSDDRDTFIGKDIEDIVIIYPQGRGKYVKILIQLENKICTIVFRNKQGGIHPSSMLVTFKEK